MVLSLRTGLVKPSEFEAWLILARVVAVAFDERQSALAFAADQRWGKGNHPAPLNLGDCAA